MGEERMLAGLQAFVTKWKDGVETPEGLDFPLIEDMVESLRPFAPDEARFDAFVAEWIFGTKLPELELGDVRVAAGESDGAQVVEGALRNIAPNGGEVEVAVRVLGAKPEEPADAKAPFEDVVVRLTGDAAGEFRVATTFKPAKIVVDPEVRLLFAGRKRCEKSL
jgi:hypothetical protein